MEQDDTGILKELVTGIRKQLSERLVSPLMPAFTISWLIVNYRLIVAILSDGSLESRLTFIDTNLYPTIQFTIVHGFLFPLAYAFVYIFAYPYPAKWIYKYSLKRQRELHEARQQAENSSVLTLEESQRLRTYYYDREASLQRLIQERQEETEQLRAKITELEKPQQQNKENITPERVPMRLLTAKELTENQAKVLGALSDAENKNREYSSEKDLLETLGYSMTDLRLILEELLMARFVSRTFNNGYIYTLTHEGRKAIKEVVEQTAAEKLAAQKEGYNSVSTEVSKQTNDSSDLSAKQQLIKSLTTGLSEYTSSPIKVKDYIKNEAMKVPFLELNEENIRSRFYGHEVDWDLNIDSIEMQENNSAIVTGSPEEPSIVSVKALVNLKQNPDVKLLTKSSKAKFVGTISSITGYFAITLQDAKIYVLNKNIE